MGLKEGAYREPSGAGHRGRTGEGSAPCIRSASKAGAAQRRRRPAAKHSPQASLSMHMKKQSTAARARCHDTAKNNGGAERIEHHTKHGTLSRKRCKN